MRIPFLIIAAFVGFSALHAQPTARTFANDPAKVRQYVYPNGFTLYVTVNTAAPRVMSIISAHAGGKNDPTDATGLAHYLEHMLFKGTDKFGTMNPEAELPLVQEIENLYERYRTQTDPAVRKQLYHVIDSVSGLAAKYAIANEYDRVCQSLGATGTNAFTSNDITAYHNDVPANRLEAYIKFEAERFRKPVLRLFHTELEAVYEEKNISLDEDQSLAYDTLMYCLFPTHTYGTQSVIGTIQHLKNPSMRRIREYYDMYYQPSNIEMFLSGDVDPDVVARWVGETFGVMPSKAAPGWNVADLPPITSPIVKHVVGPNAEWVNIAFRWPAASHHDIPALRMLDMVLSNSQAGLIDENLNLTQKVQRASSAQNVMADYSMHYFEGYPKEGQSLEEVAKLMLEQIELVKQGKFENWLIPAIIRNMEIQQQKTLETREGQAFFVLEHLSLNLPYEKYIQQINALKSVTREDVIRVANAYYKNNYVVVYKHTGERTDLEKVEKPAITPVTLNRDTSSAFANAITSSAAAPSNPTFINYDADIQRAEVRSDVPVLAVKNTNNSLFTLEYRIPYNTRQDKLLELAVSYLDFLGTKRMPADKLHREWYKLGMEIHASASDDETVISLTGIDNAFTESVQQLEDILANAKSDPQALEDLKMNLRRSRSDALKNKDFLLHQGVVPYAMYGRNNPTNNEITDEMLAKVTADQLVAILHKLTTYPHKVLYYGPQPAEAATTVIKKYHKLPAKLAQLPVAQVYKVQPLDKPHVYFLHHDMVQAEVITLGRSMPRYDSSMTPIGQLFSNYFDGGMGSIVFQTLRESKALAYGTASRVTVPKDTLEPYVMTGYIGTQADKLIDAIDGLRDLMHTLPVLPANFSYAQTFTKQNLETQRSHGMGVLYSYLTALKYGRKTDIQKLAYSQIDKFTIDDLKNYYDKAVKDKYSVIVVVGDKNKIKMSDLQKYGQVTVLEKKDVFPFSSID